MRQAVNRATLSFYINIKKVPARTPMHPAAASWPGRRVTPPRRRCALGKLPADRGLRFPVRLCGHGEGGMTPGQVAEHQSWTKGAAVSAVGHAHHGAHRVAGVYKPSTTLPSTSSTRPCVSVSSSSQLTRLVAAAQVAFYTTIVLFQELAVVKPQADVLAASVVVHGRQALTSALLLLSNDDSQSQAFLVERVSLIGCGLPLPSGDDSASPRGRCGPRPEQRADPREELAPDAS